MRELDGFDEARKIMRAPDTVRALDMAGAIAVNFSCFASGKIDGFEIRFTSSRHGEEEKLGATVVMAMHPPVKRALEMAGIRSWWTNFYIAFNDLQKQFTSDLHQLGYRDDTMENDTDFVIRLVGDNDIDPVAALDKIKSDLPKIKNCFDGMMNKASERLCNPH